MPQTGLNIPFPSMEQQSSLARRDAADCYPGRESSRRCPATRRIEMPEVRGPTQRRRRQNCNFHSFSTPFSALAAISENAEPETSDEEHKVISGKGVAAFNKCPLPSDEPLISRSGVKLWAWTDKAIDGDEERPTMMTKAVELQQGSQDRSYRETYEGSDMATHVALNDFAQEGKIEIAVPLLPVVGLQGNRMVCSILLKTRDQVKV